MSQPFQNARCAEARPEHSPRLGLRWQAQRDTAFASERPSRPKAPSPLRSAGALHIALLLLLALAASAQDSVRTLAGLPETPGSADGTNTTARFNDPAEIGRVHV